MGCKNAFIDLVNPKFKNFNRPCLLAVAVLIPTVLIFVLTLVSLLAEVNTQTGVVPGYRYEYLAQKLRGQINGCITFGGHINTKGEKASESRCRLPNPRLYCADEREENARSSLPECYPGWPGPQAQHKAHPFWKSTGGDRSAWLCWIEYREDKQTFGSAIGVALGYTGFIEFAVTMILVPILYLCRCISFDDSYNKMSVKRWIKEEMMTNGSKEAGKAGSWATTVGISDAMP